MNRLIVPAIAGLLILCGLSRRSSVRAHPQPALPDSVFNGNDTFVVLPPPADYWMKEFPVGAKPSSVYYRELGQIRNLLTKVVSGYNEGTAKKRWKNAVNTNEERGDSVYFFIDLPVYRVQLVPYVDSAGQKQVWVNCFAHYPPEKNSGWPEEFADWK